RLRTLRRLLDPAARQGHQDLEAAAEAVLFSHLHDPRPAEAVKRGHFTFLFDVKEGRSGSVSTLILFGACSVAHWFRHRYKLPDGNFSIATEGAERGLSFGAATVAGLSQQVLPTRVYARPTLRLPGAARVLRAQLSTHRRPA